MTGRPTGGRPAPSRAGTTGADDLNRGCLDELVGHLLRHAFLRGHQAFADVFEGDEITPLQFMAMELISCNPGVMHRETASALSCAPSVLTTALKPIIASGMLERILVDGDRRRTAYRLSPAGVQWFAALRPKIDQAEADLLMPLSPDEQSALKEILLRIVGRGSA